LESISKRSLFINVPRKQAGIKSAGTQITNEKIKVSFNFSTIFHMYHVAKTIFHPKVGKKEFHK
jgi:hypothetical protein